MSLGNAWAITNIKKENHNGTRRYKHAPNLAKVGVEGSNPFARSKFIHAINGWYRLQLCLGPALLRGGGGSEAAEEQFGSGFRLPSPSPVLISIPVVALRSEELRVPPSAVLVCAVSL